MSASTSVPSPSASPSGRAAAARRPSPAARRAGYAVAVVVNVALLVGVNWWPGWQVLPFLTADTTQVLGLVNASFVLAVVLNAVYLVHDPRWLTTLGTLATSAVGVAVLGQALAVFPFDLPGAWPTVVRVLLVVGLVGTAIACLVAIVTLVRLGRGNGPQRD